MNSGLSHHLTFSSLRPLLTHSVLHISWTVCCHTVTAKSYKIEEVCTKKVDKLLWLWLPGAHTIWIDFVVLNQSGVYIPTAQTN